MALLGLGLSGCSPEARDKYDQAGDTMSKATSQTGDAIKTDAQNTGEAIKDGAQEAGQAIDNSGMTGQIRAAISAAHDLKIKDLNVDTVDKKVILKGTVANQEAKDQAQKIAEGQVGKDYTVDNQLQIGSVD